MSDHDDVRAMLRADLRDALGKDADEEMLRRADEYLEGQRPAKGSQALAGALRESRILIVSIVLMLAGIAGLLLAALVGDAFVVLAMVIIAAAGAAVVITVLRMTAQVEKPDPSLVSKLEAAGYTDPEAQLNSMIEAAQGQEPGSRAGRVAGEDEGRVTEPGEDQAAATEDQQSALTPSSDATVPSDERGSA